MPNLPDVLNCPSGPATYDQEGDGEGYGSSKDAALSAARSQASTKLDISVQCAEGCQPPEVVVVEPEYDCRRPVYTAYKNGWKCEVRRCRVIQVTCKARG